jgi:hypothetical protein
LGTIFPLATTTLSATKRYWTPMLGPYGFSSVGRLIRFFLCCTFSIAMSTWSSEPKAPETLLFQLLDPVDYDSDG